MRIGIAYDRGVLHQPLFIGLNELIGLGEPIPADEYALVKRHSSHLRDDGCPVQERLRIVAYSIFLLLIDRVFKLSGLLQLNIPSRVLCTTLQLLRVLLVTARLDNLRVFRIDIPVAAILS